eukprot:1447064-Rhodomonas_salina.3
MQMWPSTPSSREIPLLIFTGDAAGAFTAFAALAAGRAVAEAVLRLSFIAPPVVVVAALPSVVLAVVAAAVLWIFRDLFVLKFFCVISSKSNSYAAPLANDSLVMTTDFAAPFACDASHAFSISRLSSAVYGDHFPSNSKLHSPVGSGSFRFLGGIPKKGRSFQLGSDERRANEVKEKTEGA